MFTSATLLIRFVVTIWLLYVSGEEITEEMEKKAAVDCKMVKKTNSRTMNFTDKGKEYVCKQLIEKEHKLFTFFKVPESDEFAETPISNQIIGKNVPQIRFGGKKYFVVSLNQNQESKRIPNPNNNSKWMVEDKNLQPLVILEFSTLTPLVEKQSRKRPAQLSRNIVRNNVRSRMMNERPFKLSFPTWFKIPTSSQDSSPVGKSYRFYKQTVPNQESIDLVEKRPVHKNKTTKTTPQGIHLKVTPDPQSYILKYVENVPTVIEQPTSVTLPAFTEGVLNKISISYDSKDELEPDQLDYFYPELIKKMNNLIMERDNNEPFANSQTTTPNYKFTKLT